MGKKICCGATWPLLWQMTGLVVERTGFAGQVNDPYAFLTEVVRATTPSEAS